MKKTITYLVGGCLVLSVLVNVYLYCVLYRDKQTVIELETSKHTVLVNQERWCAEFFDTRRAIGVIDINCRKLIDEIAQYKA